MAPAARKTFKTCFLQSSVSNWHHYHVLMYYNNQSIIIIIFRQKNIFARFNSLLQNQYVPIFSRKNRTANKTV